jgi:flagellar biosynthesis/type III secretory pathway chaperone
MTPDSPVATLTALLTRECELVMSLVDVLSDEQTGLVKIDSDRLLEVSTQKEALMHQLERLFQARLQACEGFGNPPGVPALENWMQSVADQDLNVRCLIDNFKSSLRQAQRLNNLNGTLVAEQLSTLQQRLSIITKARDLNPPPTYGPDGTFGASSPFTQRAATR